MDNIKREISPWILAFIVAIAAFMEVLDISIANVSLLHIAGSLSSSQDESTWVLTSYTLTNGIIIPLSGWLSAAIGRKRLFMFCIVGFSITSLLCGLAPTLGTLIVFRALQGITGGGLQPCSQAILADAFPPALRGTAFAVYGIAVVFAPAIGPILGGWITDNFSWRWVFLINLPIGLILFPLIKIFLHDPEYLTKIRTERKKSPIKIDYMGFGLLAVGLSCLQIMLDRGQQDNWLQSGFILSLAIFSAVGLICFIIWEFFEKDPVVDVHLFKNINFAISFFLMFILGFVLFSSIMLLPLYVQNLLGYTATDAGLVLTPGGFAVMLLMPVVGKLIGKVQARSLLVFGYLLSGLGLLYMINFDTQTDYNTIMITRTIQMAAFAFLFIPINTVAFNGIPRERYSNASGIINMARNIGGSVGISLATTLLARRSQFHQSHLVEHINTLNPNYQHHILQLKEVVARKGQIINDATANALTYQDLVGQSTMLAYLDDFKILAILFFALIPLVFFLKKNLGSSSETDFTVH